MISRVMGGLGKAIETCSLGRRHRPHPSLTEGDAFALLINHLLSIYYAPTILRLSLHLAFSIILFTENFPRSESTQLGTGLKVQGKEGGRGAGVRKDGEERGH